MMSEITNLLLDSLDALGYFGVFLTMFLESGVFPPIPSEVVLGTIGLLVYQDEMSILPAVIAASFGNMFGTIFLYSLAKYGGTPFVKKYGGYFGVDDEKIQKGSVWFNKYGDMLIFFAQMVPTARSFVSIPAGLLNKNIVKVCFYSFLGAFIWTTFIIYIASQLGEEWEKVVEWLDGYSLAVYALLLLTFVTGIVYFIYKKRQKKIVTK